ncbi:hypothetical protein [Fundidesulfovibrio agrisoli]|uniref:hypothetical protein n=1 Tax=Fundidesulfovibrio agrisoli TaxID=2922717 RepID=UPI001FAD9D18|nr:hypothetical protein [Fundidesulfovibrio agrisoli]
MPSRTLSLFLGVIALLVALGASPALAQQNSEKPGPSGTPISDGTLTMEFGQGGFILSASGGNGMLTFKGRKHVFKVGSLGVGGFGVSKVSAVGEVYNLKKLEDFPGAYFQARAGYAAGDGKGVLWLENSNGVVLKLRTKTKGLALSLGADGLLLEMGDINRPKKK